MSTFYQVSIIQGSVHSDILVASQINKLNGIINFLNGLQPIISSKKYELLFYSKRDHEFYLSNSASSAYYKIKWYHQVERHLKKIWTSPSESDLDSILPAKMRNQQWLTTMDLLLASERKEENQLIRLAES